MGGQEEEEGLGDDDKQADIIWINQNYDKLDPRKKAPVPRRKVFNNQNDDVIEAPPEWRHQVSPPIFHYSRHHEENGKLKTWSPAERCQEFSTLRQMARRSL